MIRALAERDLERVREIERQASDLFRSVGWDDVADDEPDSVPVLRAYAAAGRAFVAVTADDRPAGYILLRELDGSGYIAQVSIDPAFARRRIGAGLIDRAADWAREQGLFALSLTTFVDLPWNAPYYRRLGFVEIAAPTPGLAQVRAAEKAAGLDRRPRTAMICLLQR